MSKQHSRLRRRDVPRRRDIASMLGLLVHVEAHAGESLPGYLHRLGEANGLSGVFVTNLFKAEIRTSDDMLDSVAAIDPNWRGIAREMAAPSTRPMQLWNLRRRRFCGQCLAENGFRRAAWDLSLVTCCTKHRVRLRDTCRHCGKTFDWKEHATPWCSVCGGDLCDKGGANKADTSELWLVRELQFRLEGNASHRDGQLGHLALGELHEFGFRIGACASRPKARRPLKIADSGSLAEAAPVAAGAAALLQHWPCGFAQGLDRIRSERGRENVWKLGDAFGPIYREIYDHLPGPAFQFARDAVEQYVLDKWEAPLALRHRRLHIAAVEGHRWLSVDDAANRVGLDSAIVARVADAGELTCRSQVYDSGRVARVVDVAKLQEIADELRGTVTVEKAAGMLGLSKKRVVRLINAGILKAWGGKPSAGTTWHIGRSALENVLRLVMGAPSIERIDDDKVCLADMMRYTAREDGAFCAILTGVMNGTIKIAGTMKTERRIRGWVFERSAINDHLDRPVRFADEIGIVAVADILRIKQEVAYALVEHGAIRSRARKINGRETRVVRTQDIESFQAKYMFGSALAKSLGCSPKSLVSRLLTLGIRPAGGPVSTKRPCRQYYWKRSDRLNSMLMGLL